MAKWIGHFFRGHREDGTFFPMYGPAYRGLALCRISKGTYALTHMRTGARVITVEGDYASVRKLSEAVAELADWDTLESREAVLAVPGLPDRIAHLASFYSSEDAEVVGHG